VRLATIAHDGAFAVAVVREQRVLRTPSRFTMRGLAAEPADLLDLRAWAEAQPSGAGVVLAAVTFGPAVADPGAIYTVGLNYDGTGASPRPDVPLIYGKAPSSVAAHGATLTWDRSVTDDVDAEVELGVVIGPAGSVFGYTIINDISARDERLDGDQWLLGKSMPGFCPVGPWIVTADRFDPSDLRIGCTINGEAIQSGRTSDMRFSVSEVIAYLGRHLTLRAGDLIAMGTPVRLTTPPGPGRRLRAGDIVIASIEGIGDLTTRVA
jgi:2-keto-4-pentenoate hydratase/2-oxohepta-3-ene-1,7-dioic acid hydratase in catechol pathway